MSDLPHRKIHLDFHTHPTVQVGADFDPERFAYDVAATGADGIVLFAKDHYGYTFYRGSSFPVHPRLETDFLPAAAKACRDRGIYTEAYISVCLDNLAWQAHPDWACRNAQGNDYRWGEPNVLLDPASPLIEEVALPFTREVARDMEVDGLWFDIVLYPDDCFYSQHLTQELKRRDLEDTPLQRGLLARTIAIETQQRLRTAALAENPDLGIVFNNQALPGDTRAWPPNTVIDIESDPSVWPLFDMPLRARYAVSAQSPDSEAVPHCALTTRFHRCWGDFGGLRSRDRLEWELGRIFASGTTRVALGDHLHPRGAFDKPVIELMARAFDHCKQVAPLVEGARPLSEVALLIEPNENPYATTRREAQDAQLGAAKFLTSVRRQYAVRDIGASPATGEVMLLPGGAPLGAAQIEQVKLLVDAGHPLLACGGHIVGFEELVGATGSEKTALSGQYLLYQNELSHPELGEMPIALYDAIWRLKGADADSIVARCLPPLFDETLVNNYHPYGPADFSTPPLPAIVRRGNVVLCGAPLPALVHREDAWYFNHALDRLLGMLSPYPIVEVSSAGHVEAAVHRRGNVLFVHLVARPDSPIGPLQTALKLTLRPAATAPGGGEEALGTPVSVRRFERGDYIDLDYSWDSERLSVRIELDRPHEIVTIDFSARV